MISRLTFSNCFGFEGVRRTTLQAICCLVWRFRANKIYLNEYPVSHMRYLCLSAFTDQAPLDLKCLLKTTEIDIRANDLIDIHHAHIELQEIYPPRMTKIKAITMVEKDGFIFEQATTLEIRSVRRT